MGWWVVKRSVLWVPVLLSAFASSALAADFSVRGKIGESLSGSDNYFLIKEPLGSTYKTLTAGNLDFLARTPDTRLLLDTNFSYFDYFGSGAANTSPQSGTPAAVRFQIDRTTELDKYNFAATWHRADVATTQLLESGIVTSQGFLDSYKIEGGVEHDLSRTDSIGIKANATDVTFTNSTRVPYLDIGTEVFWKHLIDPTTKLTTTAGFNWYDANDPGNSQRLFWQIVADLEKQVSQRLKFNASVGGASVNTYQKNALPVGAPPAQFQSGASSSWLARILITYKLFERMRILLSAGESLVPTTYGAIQQITSVGMAVKYDINPLSDLSFFTQFAHNDFSSDFNGNGSGPEDLFSVGVGYRYRLARDWSTDLSYRYRQRNNSSGFANANIVQFGLNYDFTLVGNPNAWDERDAERQRARDRRRSVQAFPGLL
jgi:opacity protein-like surface antigen